MQNQPDKSIQRILVVRLSAIGDVCHAMAVVARLQERYPHAEITWITSPLEANLVRLLPKVNVVIYDKKSGLKGMLALRQSLKANYYDILLHMQWSLRASLLTRMVRVRRRIGFSKAFSREKQHWFVNEWADEPKGAHVLDSLLSIAAPLGIETPLIPCPLDLPTSPTESPLPDEYVVLNPSASKAERNWTFEGYQSVIRYLREKKLAVVLTGGPSAKEKALAGRLMAEGVINLTGQTNLPEMMSVLRDAKLVISPDTGPAHMATLVGTPVLGLYAHSNPRRTGPYRDLERVVSVYETLAEKEYGKAVSELPWATRVHDPKAMQYIQEDVVLEQLSQLI
ncbi:glycosyltransferase family 9 protein [Marinomonas mediterranea]|jgi:ADP-heptose:LPS heptosyltransferase|uniref:Glycosyl transferase family 9 n=1 Tax=Marinomonas mediterranea (strain ATCC 700492 / JCM 21426 / NBRC 103028 / MMB-1) TaxID=717774 RepID=F2JZV6_MARM1|nr:glycosyltransferase family 9 protein [Marinomonas mediterranea]ADZ92068.1 glycosyl transferase family 9 [Marinomonas mediterranea MMB-1]WCN10031.1 lipopolysaccharide heptosyltransferase family protein [Marinomonas mediterranea]WCN18137.1 lipopolysaccharide heptosyltransferase family protein [Marinomonas mediterranea MMB-1]